MSGGYFQAQQVEMQLKSHKERVLVLWFNRKTVPFGESETEDTLAVLEVAQRGLTVP